MVVARTSKPVTVTLGELQDRVYERVDNGSYASVSEVLRAGLRALDREEAALNDWMRARIEESLADPRPDIPIAEAFADLRAHHEARMRSEGEEG
jgi:antitoxin ParD1/3/4